LNPAFGWPLPRRLSRDTGRILVSPKYPKASSNSYCPDNGSSENKYAGDTSPRQMFFGRDLFH
jgi:hypothetical protein